MTDERRRGLGRGLSALLGESEPAAAAPAEAKAGIRMVAIEHLHPGRFQPRKRFDEDAMAALAASVAAQGVLQPLLVRRSQTMLDGFEIIAGERRWRAAQRARLVELPVLVHDLDDRAALELAIVENVQREDLQPLEEARGYQRLIEEFRYTQEQLASRVGKSRSHVANMIRLLGLPEAVKLLLEDGRLTAGHARALLGAADPEALAQQVLRLDLSVRQTERAAQAPRPETAKDAAALRDPNVAALEHEMTTVLGLKVSIRIDGPARGSVEIRYRSLDQLDSVLAKLKAPATGR
jgi:ParB family chromosome partitioning protein